MAGNSRCSVLLFGSGYSFSGSPCSRPVTVRRDGKDYCTIHDPERVSARRKVSDEKYRRRIAAEVVEIRLNRAAPYLLEACLAFLRAGFGNSTDFRLQAEAFGLARVAAAKATGEQP